MNLSQDSKIVAQSLRAIFGRRTMCASTRGRGVRDRTAGNGVNDAWESRWQNTRTTKKLSGFEAVLPN